MLSVEPPVKTDAPRPRWVEEALRRYFGLRGLALLDEIRDSQGVAGVALDDAEAMSLAIAELRAVRAERARRASA